MRKSFNGTTQLTAMVYEFEMCFDVNFVVIWDEEPQCSLLESIKFTAWDAGGNNITEILRENYPSTYAELDTAIFNYVEEINYE